MEMTGVSSCLGMEGMGVGTGLPDTSPGNPMPPESPKAETPGSNQKNPVAFPRTAGLWAWKETIPAARELAGGGFRPEDKLSQEPGEPKNLFSKAEDIWAKVKSESQKSGTQNLSF